MSGNDPIVSKAPPPPTIHISGTGGGQSKPRYQARISPDWSFWPPSRPVAPWQAVALSLNLDPDSLKHHPYGRMARSLTGLVPPPFFLSESFPDAETETAFKKRSDLLASYRPAHHELLPLQDFATWAASVNLSPIPTELAVHAIQDTDQTTEVPTEPEQAKNETQEGITPEDELAALFEPVSVAALEKMFPDNGRWRNHAERAARNGLSVAREDRGKFNPYLAAIWWLNKKKPSGWDLARVHRTLANNLPARSLDSKHFLIGEIE